MEPRIGEVDANLEGDPRPIPRGHGRSGARLVVFPECALTGYGFETKDEAMRYAEPIPGLSSKELGLGLRRDRCVRDLRAPRTRRRPALQRRRPGRARMGVVGLVPQGPPAVPRGRSLRRPGRPAVRGPGGRRPPGRDAHLLRRDIPRNRPGPDAPGGRSARPAHQLADPGVDDRRAPAGHPRHRERRLRDGRQPGGRGARLPLRRDQLDRRARRRDPRQGRGSIPRRSSTPTSTRRSPARKRLVRVPGNTNSTGSPIVAPGFTARSSPRTARNDGEGRRAVEPEALPCSIDIGDPRLFPVPRLATKQVNRWTTNQATHSGCGWPRSRRRVPRRRSSSST